MSFRKYILLTVVGALLIYGTAFGAVRARAQVDSDTVIYVGEEFGYHVIIDGVQKPGQVDMSSLDVYMPQYVGGSDRSQTSISIVNGKKTEKVSQHYVMSYRLTANKGGAATLAIREGRQTLQVSMLSSTEKLIGPMSLRSILSNLCRLTGSIWKSNCQRASVMWASR